MRPVIGILIAVLTCSCVTAPAQTTLRFRAGMDAPVDSVKSVTIDGVECVSTGGATFVLSWDRVAEIRGGPPAQAAQEFGAVAESAWRARTRLSRGDTYGAEPLFESLFVRYNGRSGPTAALVASGLLRCRVSRQAQAASVAPWLALVASGSKEVTFDTPTMAADGVIIAPLMDEATGLAPSLPPIWVAGPLLQAVIALEDSGTLASDGTFSSRRASVLRGLYVRAARATLGEPITLDARPEVDEGQMLVWDVVAVRFGAAQQRQQARALLRQRIASADIPLWVEAWCRVALGMALVHESDEEQRLLGLAQLAHAPARLESVSPYLAGVALAEIARVLEDQSQQAASSRAWRELEERYPDHPALAARTPAHREHPTLDEQDPSSGGQP